MLPLLLWFALGLSAAILAVVRIQLELLAHQWGNGWLVAASGLLGGGWLMAIVLLIGLRLRSPKAIGGLLVGAPIILMSLGFWGAWAFPATNFKNRQVQGEWGELHPTLRLALWVVRLGDSQLVLTDIARQPENYGQMGLAKPATSAHYVDEDGYARAIDLLGQDETEG